jgi:hypothetical protein
MHVQTTFPCKFNLHLLATGQNVGKRSSNLHENQLYLAIYYKIVEIPLNSCVKIGSFYCQIDHKSSRGYGINVNFFF